MKFNQRIKLKVTVGLIVASTSHVAVSAVQISDFDSVVDVCTSSILSDSVPGAAVSLVYNNEIIFEQGYGEKNANTDELVNKDTLFKTGSTQKMMTAAALVQQSDQQLIKLEDSVNLYLPELTFSGRWNQENITIEQLLNHTSGVPNYGTLHCGGDENTLSQWAQSINGNSLLYRPGAFWNYSNGAYSLAGLIAETVAGIPFHQVMKNNIWHPSGMMNTFQTVAEALEYENISYGHSIDPDTGEVFALPVNAYECWWTQAAGDAFTTAGDMARWSIMLMDEESNTLSIEAKQSILTASVDTAFPFTQDYGLGTFITDLDGITAVHHGGHVPGWNTNQVMLPEVNFSISVLTNGDYGAGEISNCILEHAIGVIWPQPELITTDPQSWKKYQGIYHLKNEEQQTSAAFVYLFQNKLWLTAFVPDQSRWIRYEAQQVSGNVFFIDIDEDGMLSQDIELLTFIKDITEQRPSMWLRSFAFVGERLFK